VTSFAGLLVALSIAMFAERPPTTVVYRNWVDLALGALFIFFATYKGIRLVKTTRLGWSFAIYNFVLAMLFFSSLFLWPNTHFPPPVEGAVSTMLRVALVLSIAWCVGEVELSRKSLREDGSGARRGGGQQT
jgi:hypothetical protein